MGKQVFIPPLETKIKVPFRHYDCTLTISRYVLDDSIALQLVDRETHEPIATATVYMEGAVPLEPNQVWIKDYSENEGMYAALEAAIVITSLERHTAAGFVTVQAAQLQPYIMSVWNSHVTMYKEAQGVKTT